MAAFSSFRLGALLCRHFPVSAYRPLRLTASSQKYGMRFISDREYMDDILSESVFTEEHLKMRHSLRKVIEKDINPYVEEWEKRGEFPAHTVFKKLGDGGFLGVCKPVEYGGLGLDYTYSVALAEELGNIVCGSIPMAIGVQTDMATPGLARHGSDELRRNFLAPAVAGDQVVCLGVSEPGAGSDVANIQTKAVRQGDDLIINGGKMWITSGKQADWMCMLANTNGGPSHSNKSLIIVPMNLPGVHVARTLDKLGMRSSDTAQIFFEDVRVPASHIIGQEGMGFVYQMQQFQEERMWAAANVVVPLQNMIRDTIDYTSERKIFGSPVLNHQVVHYRLAELETEVELLRSLVYRTIGLYTQGRDVVKLASMAKLKAGRLAREVTDTCLQYWGGMGFTNEVLISRLYRDLRLISIGGGADEVMLGIIAKSLRILPKPPSKGTK